MISLIAAVTTEATSTVFVMSGEGKIISDPLATGEYATLLEERPNGDYLPVPNDKGLGVVLRPGQESHVFVGYGNYKVYKSVTAAAVGVGLEQ